MATRPTLTATDTRDAFARGATLASAIDRPCVLNSDAKTASADATDLLTILGSEAETIEMPVPPGANYLKACLVYVGTAPSVACSFRAFGRVPILKQYSEALLPKGIDSGYDEWTLGKGDGEGLWVPRGNDASGAILTTLSSTVAMKHGDTLYCEPSLLHVGGCDRVALAVATACVGPTSALIFGWFEQ